MSTYFDVNVSYVLFIYGSMEKKGFELISRLHF